MQSRVAAFIVVVLIGLSGMISFHVPPLQFVSGFLAQALSPIQEFIGDPARQATEFVSTVQEMGELRAENARLRAEVGQLRADSARLGELTQENDQLHKELNLKQQQPSYEWLEARVIDRDASNLVHSVAINRGSNDGIVVGMTVITPAGLVGQITRVGPSTARVLLITDVSSSVTALIQGSRAEGVVNGHNGEGSPYLVMTYIPQPAVVKTGDNVITSGVGGIFPNGIPIGRVTSVSQKDIDPFQEARVDPNVDFQQLETVLVITNYVPLRLE